MHILKIETNPYLAKVSIRVFDDTQNQWYLPQNSDFERFEGRECVFAFCVEDILQIIARYWKGVSGICFTGTIKDYNLLKEKAIKYAIYNNKGQKLANGNVPKSGKVILGNNG